MLGICSEQRLSEASFSLLLILLACEPLVIHRQLGAGVWHSGVVGLVQHLGPAEQVHLPPVPPDLLLHAVLLHLEPGHLLPQLLHLLVQQVQLQPLVHAVRGNQDGRTLNIIVILNQTFGIQQCQAPSKT